MMVGLL